VIDEQSATIRDFVTALIQDIFHRYAPSWPENCTPGSSRADWKSSDVTSGSTSSAVTLW
jgi:hypothetical protein